MNCLSARDLSVSFSGRRVIDLKTLDLPQGGVTVITGASGSGKSTLLRAFNRLNEFFPDSLTRGTIEAHLGGSMRSIYDLPIDELRRKIGLVFQHPNVLPVSILKNFTLPLTQGLGWPRARAEAAAEETLRSAGLWPEVMGRLKAPAETLSGGQKQRLCLARALALEPEILLLDEPTSSLDRRSAGLVEELITDISRQVTIILVTHSQAQAEKLGQHFFDLEKFNQASDR